MAYDIGIADDFSGRPNHDLYLYVRRDQTDTPNNRSSYAWALYARRLSGAVSFYNGAMPWYVEIAGQGFANSSALPFSSGTSQLLLGSGSTGWVGHDAAGYLAISVGASMDANASQFDVAGTSAWFYPDRIPKPPDAPSPLGIDEVQTTSFRYRFNGNGDGGGGISGWEIEYWITGSASTIIGSSGTSTLTGLAPGSTYNVRSRGYNPYGYSPWSSVLSQTTLPAEPPGISVAPSVSGQSAVITLTPPGGVSGVTKYKIERRIGTGTAVPTETTTTTQTQTGLTPGTAYQWRASAVIGGYESPWSSWVTVTMPSPNTNPGDFYDGSKAATSDVVYAWVGGAENSISSVSGYHPVGRRTFSEAAGAGATGAVYRVTGGVHGAYGSRTVFFSDATSAGYRGGQALANPGLTAVQGNQSYWGSVFVKPSRSQRMAAEITYLNASFAVVGSVAVGTAEVVGAGVTRRLTVQATAPATAVWASVGWRDVSGTGWSTWKGGDSVVDDALMIGLELFDYFDGNTIDGIYQYAWTGPVNASTSTRSGNGNVGSVDDLLFDPDCVVIPSPPRPPTVLDDCIEEVGVWRRYWIQVPPGEISAWAKEIPTLEMTTGPVAERQVRVRYYANPLGLTLAQASQLREWIAEQVISYIPPLTKITLDGISERSWANVGSADAVPADHLLYGTGGEPASWPALTCGIGYLIALDTPTESPVGNLSSALSLTQRV